MKALRSHLRRHLTYANVMASIAVFLALGGAAYAAAKINGNKIVNHTIAAKKLKKKTLTSKQVRKNALKGSVIKESTLGTVPRAKSAQSATTATNAGHAETAATADYATGAGTAGDAETLGGRTAAQLTVACPAATELFGGMCWDAETREATGWIAASIECAEAGGRLPTLSELIAYVAQPGEQVSGQTWTGDVADAASGEQSVATTTEGPTTEVEAASAELGYRCLFYRVN